MNSYAANSTDVFPNDRSVDMLTHGALGVEDEGNNLNFPDINAIKSCSKMSTGFVNTWGDKSLVYRADVNGPGVIIAGLFIADSKIDEIRKQYGKNCMFKTSIAGKDAFFNIIGDGKDRKISFSQIAPSEKFQNNLAFNMSQGIGPNREIATENLESSAISK